MTLADQIPITQLKQSKNAADPRILDLLDQYKKAMLLDLKCHDIGTIQSFNKDAQTAQVTINYKKTYNLKNGISGIYENVLVDYPILLDVPVVVLRGGGARLTFPIVVGDQCVVMYNDRSIDGWFQSGQVGPITSPRLHSISDGIALVGLSSMANPLEDYEDDFAGLNWGETSVGVTEDKVRVKNADQNLKDLLQDLCDKIGDLTSAFVTNAAALVVSTPSPGSPAPLNPAIVTALNNVSTAVDTLSTNLGDLLE